MVQSGGGDWLTTFSTFFVAILLEAMPFVLLGALLSGIIEVAVPKEQIARIVPKNRFQAILLFGLLGIVFPVCECGIVPVIRRLLQKGVPLSCGITYLLAAPIVQPIVLAATFVAFNGSWKIAGLRIVGGYLVAISVGCLAIFALDPHAKEHIAFDIASPTNGAGSCSCGADHLHDYIPGNGHAPALLGSVTGFADGDMAANTGSTIVVPKTAIKLPLAPAHDHNHDHGTPATFMAKVESVLTHSSEEFLTTGYYLIFGALLAAAMQTFIGQSALTQLGHGPVLGTLVMMALAFTLSLCSAADAFVAATFSQFSIAARMGFLVMGPMVDIKLVAMYNGFLSRKATFFVFGMAALLTFVYAMAIRPIAG
jgi:uncharacterized membrane protein YraQ (UPF0718 family)